MKAGVGWAVVVVAVASPVLLTGCSSSPETLERVVQDKPGVVSVHAVENDCDDCFGFETIPKTIRVRMDADSSQGQIMAVFEAYSAKIDDGNIQGIDVVLEDDKKATLSTGEDIHATRGMVEDLVAAQKDEDVLAYRREAYPVMSSVDITIAPTEFPQVLAVANRYRNADEIELVEVSSGRFLLIRDSANGDPALSESRERFVEQVNVRFRLTGAIVDSRGPLKLFVAAGDQKDLRAYVDAHVPGQALGRVIVRARP